MYDPDFAGKLIRERIMRRVPGVKHVYLSRECAKNERGDDIGLENVSPEEIRKAFARVLAEDEPDAVNLKEDQADTIRMEDLIAYELVGQKGSAAKRSALGKILGIGDTNAKQFLYRVNRYALSKEEFLSALRLIERKDQ
jgi:ribonuclease M5